MKTRFYTLFVSLLLPGFTLLSSAQEPNAPANRPGNRPPPGNFQRGGPPRGMRSLGPGQGLMSVLTEEQRASLRNVMVAQRDKTRELEQKLRAARQELLAASFAAKVSEKVIREKGKEIGKLEAELAVLRARAFSKIQPPLSPDQIEQLKKSMSEMRPPRNGPPPEAGVGGPPPERVPQRDGNDLPPPVKP